MALAAAQTLAIAGTAPSYATPGAFEFVIPMPGLFIHVKNANAVACVVTLADPGRTPGGSVGVNPTVSVPATTGDRMIPLPPSFRHPSFSDQIVVQFSITASVTAAVLRLV